MHTRVQKANGLWVNSFTWNKFDLMNALKEDGIKPPYDMQTIRLAMVNCKSISHAVKYVIRNS